MTLNWTEHLSRRMGRAAPGPLEGLGHTWRAWGAPQHSEQDRSPKLPPARRKAHVPGPTFGGELCRLLGEGNKASGQQQGPGRWPLRASRYSIQDAPSPPVVLRAPQQPCRTLTVLLALPCSPASPGYSVPSVTFVCSLRARVELNQQICTELE